MKRKLKLFVPVVFFVALVVLAAWYLHGHNIPVLHPAGEIGQKERGLMIIAGLLSLVVVIPVYVMTIAIVMRYRVENHKKKTVTYHPDWESSWQLETIWWGIPIIIIAFLSVVTWTSTHALDPYKPLASSVKPLQIEVVAMDWKWLFIYPQQGIASVNLAEVPLGTPLDITLTSDTVMNSFWVPQLGGQIYAMPGMFTQLHLSADKAGNYYGSPANISGVGYAHMTFNVRAVSAANFTHWVQTAQASSQPLTLSSYHQLARPSIANPVTLYSHVTPGLFNGLVMQYMEPTTQGEL